MIAKKRLLPILLAALMVFAMMPMTAGTVLAESEEAPFVILCVDWYDAEQKVYLGADNLITDQDLAPPIGTEFDNDIIVEGYYSDIDYTKPVDVSSPIPEELFGKKIYINLTVPDERIYVDGVGVTKENHADVLGDQTVSFDYHTMTLTLKNADLTVTDEYPAVGYSSFLPITLHLEGKNTITGSNLQENTDSYGAIISTYGILEISGPGSLNISLENIYGGYFAGIYVENNLIVNSDLDINISSIDDSYGLVAWGKTVFDGTHTNINAATTAQGETVGIGSQYGDIDIQGDSDVNVNANVGIEVGIYDPSEKNELNVIAGSRIELSCGWAFRNIRLSDATKALGVYIKTAVDAAVYELWDGTTDLNTDNIKCILISGQEISHVKAKEPTCVAAGNTEYWIVTEGGNTKYYSDAELTHEIASLDEIRIPATGKHTWDTGKITKEPTETAKGVKTYKCKVCGETKTEEIPAKGYTPGGDPNQKGKDGTDVGPGASEASADRAITHLPNDNDPAGSVYGKLQAKSTKQTKNSVNVKWSKVSGATKYVIYGNACGKKIKMKKLATSTGKSMTFKKIAGKKVKKGTYYKFIIVALDKNNNVVSTSKIVHVATKGGKVGNHKSVTVKKTVLKKAKKLKKGKSLKLKAKAES